MYPVPVVRYLYKYRYDTSTVLVYWEWRLGTAGTEYGVRWYIPVFQIGYSQSPFAQPTVVRTHSRSKYKYSTGTVTVYTGTPYKYGTSTRASTVQCTILVIKQVLMV